VLIGFLAVAAYVTLRFLPHLSQQHFNIRVAQVFIFTFLAMLLWLLAFSRMRWRMRLGWFAVVLGFIASMGAAFRIRGVTGNLVPILEPRWVHRSLSSPSLTATNAGVASIPGAADFPQFLGPNRNAVLRGPRLATNWVAQRPPELWRQPVGAAWSGFAVSGAVALTQEQRGEEECVVAYDLRTGQALWSHGDRVRYFTTLAGEGPRATPTVTGSKVLAQGATGLLNCLDLATGRVLWSKDILKENQSHVPSWGFSSSPLVVGDLVVVGAGGHQDRSVVAYRVADGSFAWGGGRRGSTYSSPALTSLDGVRQVVLFGDALVGHDLTTGNSLWQASWPGGHPHIAMPIFVGTNDVIVSSGYGTGSGRFHVQRDGSGQWSVKPVWRTNRMKAKFTNLVLFRGCIYGLDDGIMACLDAETGEFKWKDGKYGHGQVLLVGELLLVLAESGEVVLVDPRPDELRELTRFSALHDKTWNPPALAGEYLLVRNDKEAACFRLPPATPLP
jgi:outer membrane protein assembly factor BamB